jgi:hypothetical protein
MINSQRALVQCYIHHLKDKQIDIIYPHKMIDKEKLSKAYRIARNYFNI